MSNMLSENQSGGGDNLKIFPDHTASYSSTKNYFIDDIMFSILSNPYTSVLNPVENGKNYLLQKTENNYDFTSQSPSSLQLIDMSGRIRVHYTNIKQAQFNHLSLKEGVYLLRIESVGKIAVGKLIF